MHSDRMDAHGEVMDAFKVAFFAELEKDGYVKKGEKKVDFLAKGNKVSINGKDLSDAQSRKYIELIRRFGFNAGPDHEFNININKNNVAIGSMSRRKKEE